MRWSDEEKAAAKTLFSEFGRSFDTIADKLNIRFGNDRSPKAIRSQLTYSATPLVSLHPRKTDAIEPPERVLVYGDVHYPYQDDDAVAIMLDVAKDFDPQMIVINGDLLDNFETSSFVRKTPHFVDMREEVEMGKQHFRVLRARHPKAQILYNESNHEFRFVSYIAERAPALLPLVFEADGSPGPISLAALLELDKLNVTFNACVHGESYLDFGNILVGHWKKYSKHSAYTAKGLIEELGISLIQGHVHRIGTHARTWIRREVIGYEGGCLCGLTPEYKPHPNWQQGFCVVYFHDRCFQVQQIPIVRTQEGYMFAMFGSKMYKREIQ